MRKRSSKDRDFVVNPQRVAEQAIGEHLGGTPLKAIEKNPHAVALGRLGGQKGGRARATVLSARRRSEIARKAAQARWSKTDD